MLKYRIILFLLLSYLSLQAELMIGDLRFEGNKLTSDTELSSAIASRQNSIFSQNRINIDAERISEIYAAKGIFNVKVHTPEIITDSPDRIIVMFHIEEQEEVLVDSINISGNNYITDSKLRTVISMGDLSLIELANAIRQLTNYYAFNGFLFADVRLDRLVNTGDYLSAYININEGRFCDFKDYKFRGNKTTREETLIRISKLESADKITPSILQQAANNIRRKKYIKDCSLIPLDHRSLLFEVTEDRMNILSGLLGYDNSKTNNNRFTGWIDLEFINLYGTDRSLALNWQHFTSDISSIMFKYHESGVNRYPVNADLLISRLEVDSTYIRTKFECEIYYFELFQRYGIFFGKEDIFPGGRKVNNIERRSFNKFGALWNMTDLDNFLNPTTGSEIKIKYYYILNTLETSNVSKQAVELQGVRFVNLGKRFVLGLDINANIIENKQLSELEFFDLGGAKSLRGFDENVFSGYRIGWSDLELRYLFGPVSRLFIFGAYGYVENLNYKYDDLFSFGFGLRTKTKIGVFGIDYGLGIQNGKMRNVQDGIIHIGLETSL
ncbi:MAG: BamA/TamA family outer membrane protein [Candidatus Cloacimonetes bacterium]|nr:BamA/TamA family outer membrane protein [Candidatus Cloacimonadota bacterium]